MSNLNKLDLESNLEEDSNAQADNSNINNATVN